jgi:hypothetical protein
VLRGLYGWGAGLSSAEKVVLANGWGAGLSSAERVVLANGWGAGHVTRWPRV